MSTMNLQIIALNRMLFDGEVEMINVETTAGQMTLLANHMPLAVVLEDAPLIVKTDKGETQYIAVHKGYLSIKDNQVIVVADDAIFAHEIDEERIREDIRHNQNIVDKGEADAVDINRAKVRLQRDLINLKVHDLYHK